MAEQRAVGAHNVTPMRSEPKPGAEVVSQALFGETVKLLAEAGPWLHVETPDHYAGWALAEHFVRLPDGTPYPDPDRAGTIAGLVAPVLHEPTGDSERVTILTIGTLVELMEADGNTSYQPIRLPGGGIAYVRADQVAPGPNAAPNDLADCLVRTARRFVGVPYLWGGRTPFGIDCSGFTQRVYALCGHVLPRDAYLQARSDRLASVERGDLQAGDLLFFLGESDPRGRGITHVGMSLDGDRFVHAAGDQGVTVSTLADPPYDRQFRQAGRLVGP